MTQKEEIANIIAKALGELEQIPVELSEKAHSTMMEVLRLVKNLDIQRVSNSALIDYIETDAEIAIPIDEFFNGDGTNITKKQYGKVLLKYLVKELREHYC